MAAHTLPVLPYDYEALAPHIDATTMNIHHTKHHQAYVTNLNGALDKFPELKGMSIVEVCKAVSTDSIPKDVATVVRNNGGEHTTCIYQQQDLGLDRLGKTPTRCAQDHDHCSEDQLLLLA